jgi:hypothetical protein
MEKQGPWSDYAAPGSDPATFLVVECKTVFSWGGTYRLRLECDVNLSMQRFGHDWLGAPALQRRSFVKSTGWETDATLLTPGLAAGDRIGVSEVVEAAGLWSDWG